MTNYHHALSQLLRQNPTVQFAWIDQDTNPPTLRIHSLPGIRAASLNLPSQLHGLPVDNRNADPVRIMIAQPAYAARASDPWQACQDPPIRLGCQCQPQSANWVGTAGSMVTWQSGSNRKFGILSNWHVFAHPPNAQPRPIHQPLDNRPAIAHTVRGSEPHHTADNLVDACIADALIGEYHSIDGSILSIGHPTPQPQDATQGDQACKSGRTTQLTTGRCVGTGASVRVNYGDFTALFVDQDVYASDAHSFSAPGDSGSLILDPRTNAPMSLLFAGDSTYTIGNPIRYVLEELDCDFP